MSQNNRIPKIKGVTESLLFDPKTISELKRCILRALLIRLGNAELFCREL
jgi:hypothetical protein